MKTKKQSELLPFFLVFIGWALLGLIVLRHSGMLHWFFLIAGLSGGNLFALAKVIHGLLRLAAGQAEGIEGGHPILGIFFWLSVKFFGVGLLGYVFYAFRFIPDVVLIFGLAPWVVVPLLGGLIVSWRNR